MSSRTKIPGRPSGTTDRVKFLGLVWDKLWGPDKLIANTPTVKASYKNGTILLDAMVKPGSGGGTVDVTLCDSDTGEEVTYSLVGTKK